jgi:long-chain acyl-CoA synthetase
VPNAPQAVIAQFGAWKAGAIVAPLNPLYTEYELERALNECGAVARENNAARPTKRQSSRPPAATTPSAETRPSAVGRGLARAIV